MRKRFMSLLSVVALLAVAALGPAPAEGAEVSAKIPFSFTVRGKTLPAGTYTLSENSGVLSVQGATSGSMVIAVRVESREYVQPSLVFHRYGDQYILRQIWTGGRSGRALPEDRGERALALSARKARTAAAERVVIPIG